MRILTASSPGETQSPRPDRHEKRKLRQFSRFVAFTVITSVILFLLIEGLSSTILFFHEILVDPASEIAERRHTEYDPELGWINVPDADIKDMYGPGKYLRTNSQRFRNDRDFTIAEPHDKLRIICSGDSFTLGYGVDNEHTWCQLLTTLDERFETVNMGQGGYGVDQAYLWYKRDGGELEHSVHVFAFVTADFSRMMTDTFWGYGKPVLELRDGALVVENVPVERRAFYAPWLARNMSTVRKLRSLDFSTRLLRRVPLIKKQRADVKEEKYRDVALKVFEALAERNRRKRSTLVLVYLPTESNYRESKEDRWRQYLIQELPERGLIVFDLAEELRKVLPDQARAMFIPAGSMEYYGGSGHYTEEGNRYVAGWLYQRLLALPELQASLARLDEQVAAR